jgi:tetratricopeptide (TPR) repeat protein
MTTDNNSSAKKRLFLMLMWLIPVAAIVLPELVLRAVGYGTSLQLFRPFAANPAYLEINPTLGERYFPGKNTRPAVAQTNIMLKDKPDDLYRIFALGASTTAGYPYLYNGTFPAILKQILKNKYPDKRLEVINLAMPAVTSYAVREIALHLQKYEPDMLIIYAGHNEFYGGLGVASTASIGSNRFLVNAYLWLSDFRLVQFIRNLLTRLQQWVAATDSRPKGTLMQQLAKEQTIPFNSPLYHRAAEVFRENIRDVIRAARADNIPVLIGTLVSNVRDQAPFSDVVSDSARLPLWEKNVNSAKLNVSRKRYDLALADINQAIAVDSMPATAHFLAGETYLLHGDTLSARKAFYRAKDYDGLRFRAAENMNRIIGQFADEPNVTVVPVKRFFENTAESGIPGKQLFLEHLHPNLYGYFLMAKCFAEVVEQGGYLGTSATKFSADSLWPDGLGVTETDYLVAALRIEYLRSGWPFKPALPPSPESFRVDLEQTEPGRLARQFWLNRIGWEEMHAGAAEWYASQQMWDKAAAEYQALAMASEINPTAYLLRAKMLQNQGRFAEALTDLKKALEIEPSPQVLKQLAMVYQQLKSPEKGIPYLQQVLRQQPEDWQAWLQLAELQQLAGQTDAAGQSLKRALQINPGLTIPDVLKLQVDHKQ